MVQGGLTARPHLQVTMQRNHIAPARRIVYALIQSLDAPTARDIHKAWGRDAPTLTRVHKILSDLETDGKIQRHGTHRATWSTKK